MNVRLILQLICLMLPASSAWAIDLSKGMQDPLKSMPPVLSTGARLPGDVNPIACPPAVDLHAPLTLPEVVDLALCRDPQIQSAWAAIKLQASALGEAEAAYLPTLSASTSHLQNRTRASTSGTAVTRNQGQTLNAAFSWRLFDFGGRAAQRKAADLALSAALLSHDAALQKTLANVVGAHFEVLTTQALVQARQESVRTATDTLSATERREHAGVASQNDRLQAQTALARTQLALQRALGDHRKALAVLVYTMNLPPAAAVQIAPIEESATLTARQDLEHWLQEADARHPGIRAARAQAQAAAARIDVVRAEGLPSIAMNINHDRNGFPNQSLQANKSNTTTWGLTLSVPLFDGFARTYKIRGAVAQAEQSAAQLAETERQVLAEVVKAHADTMAALANLDASAQLLEAASAALASSERRYAKGAADILELLNQQTALADARQERVRCLSEWRAARLRLLAHTGVMDSMAVQRVW